MVPGIVPNLLSSSRITCVLTPKDFKKLILAPGVKTARELTLERTAKVLESYQNSFLGISVFITQLTNCCRKMNQSYRDIFYGCKSACPLHCVDTTAPKVRPGKFKKWPKKPAASGVESGKNREGVAKPQLF